MIDVSFFFAMLTLTPLRFTTKVSHDLVRCFVDALGSLKSKPSKRISLTHLRGHRVSRLNAHGVDVGIS